MSATEKPTSHNPWSISLDRVRDAALSIVTDADALDFACAAIELGVPSREAGLIGDLLYQRQRQSQGCIPRGCFR